MSLIINLSLKRIKGEQFVKDKLIRFIEQLEETYKKNGGGPWFCGETVSWKRYIRIIAFLNMSIIIIIG